MLSSYNVRSVISLYTMSCVTLEVLLDGPRRSLGRARHSNNNNNNNTHSIITIITIIIIIITITIVIIIVIITRPRESPPRSRRVSYSTKICTPPPINTKMLQSMNIKGVSHEVMFESKDLTREQIGMGLGRTHACRQYATKICTPPPIDVYGV